MGGSGSRAAADGPARCEALALPSAHQSQLVRAHRYAMFLRRAWSRLRKPNSAAAPYAAPPAVCNDPGLQEGSAVGPKQEPPSARAASFMGAMSSGAEERIRWRRAGRDRRRGWGFRKLKTQSDSAMSSPACATTTSPNKFPADAAGAGTISEGEPRSPATAEPDVAATTAAVAPAVDDYSCLAEDDDINWSAGYVKLCCMADALSQDCSSFQDLRKGPDHAAAAAVQSQLVVERLESVEQHVNLRDGRSAFGASGERISYTRKTATQVVTDGNTTVSTRQELAYGVAKHVTNAASPGEELLIFDPCENTSAGVQQGRAEWQGQTTSSQLAIVEDRASIEVAKRTTSVRVHGEDNDQYRAQMGLSPEPIETRRSGSTSPTRNCPVGLLIQPHQQHHPHWGKDHANADVANRDSFFNSDSFLKALQHSSPLSFPPPHPPASNQHFWGVDRGSLENYAERGDFSMTWSAVRDCSDSVASSEDSVFARRASTSSHRHRRSGARDSFDEGEVADIFMFSDDDEDLCSATDHDRCSGSSLKASGNHHQFEISLGARERGAGPQQRPLENGSGDNTMRRIELVVHT
ncbi:hypothetical protein V5799_017029 [Amblyomma americanum]|uniref:Uncharacterized protein n=1 Tax=Amblyomma americanum TaxID=6943 RepID=A0AAQ4F3I2_AMBAM